MSLKPKLPDIIDPIIEAPSIELQEKWEIIALPEKICKEPVKHSPENLNNFVNKTKLEYEKHISELGENFALVNKEIEIDIRLKSNVLKDEINLLESAGTKNVTDLLIYKKEILEFDETKFDASREKCEDILKEGIEKIDKLYEDFKDLEKIKSDKFKKILKEYYEKMEKCSYKLPSEIQKYFEEQIIRINKIILTNLRNYKELHLNLILFFTNDIKLLIQRIAKYEEDWNILSIEEIKRRLRLCDYSEEDIEQFFEKYKGKSIKELYELLVQIEEDFNDPLRIDPRDAAWYEETNSVLDDIDAMLKDLNILFEKASAELGVPRELSGCFTSSSKSLCIQRYLSTQGDELEEMLEGYGEGEGELKGEEEFIPPKIYTREELEELWKNTLKEILQFTHMQYTFSKDLEHLWKSHGKRIADIKLTVSKELEKLMDKNDKVFQEKHEQSLNIAMDTLRQDMNEKKLQKSMKKVTGILNKMINALKDMKSNEIKIVNKFQKYVDNENVIVTKAMTQFIEKYGQEQTIPEINKALGIKNMILFLKMETYDTEMRQILNSGLKILLRMENKLQTYEENQLTFAKSWIEKNVNKIEKKFDTKLEFHNQRYERIKLDILEVRISEIKKHLEMFDMHKAGTDKQLNDVQASLKEFETVQTEEINNFLEKLKEMSENSQSCTTSNAAYIYIQECDKFSKQRINSFVETVQKFTEQASQAINQVLTSNYNFLQHIKLFHEGGNFNNKEAKQFSKKIVQLETSVQKRALILKACIANLQKKLIKTIETAAAQCNIKTTTVYETLKFAEETEAKIQAIQQTLKNDVYQMKYKRKKIDTINERVKQLVSLNNFSKASCVIKYCTEIINHCKEYREYLDDSDTPSKIYGVNINATESKSSPPPSSKSKESKKSGSKRSKRSKKKEIVIINYNLYDYFDDRKFDKFMNIINHHIQDAFTDIQDAAKTFYGAGYNIDQNKIPADFIQYMNGILPKFKYYYLQCLEAWVQEIKDFVEFSKIFINFCEDYSRNFVNYAHETLFNNFKEGMNQYFKSVQNTRDLGFAEVKSVHDELKPLHGYPGNKDMLQELNEKMHITMENIKQNFNIAVEPFYDYLEEYARKYKSKMFDVTTMINEFKEQFYDENFCTRLVTKAQNVVHQTNFEDFKFDLGYIFDINEEETIKPNSETNLIDVLQTLEEDIRLQIVEEEAKIYECQFEEMRNIYYQTWTSKLKTWQIDVEKVTDLYTVKYD